MDAVPVPVGIAPAVERGVELGRRVALGLLCSAQFMVVVDSAVVNVAIPSIQRDLHFSTSGIQWVFTPTCPRSTR